MYLPLSLEQDPKDLQYYCSKFFVSSRPFSLLLTRPSATFEVSTMPVEKLTRDSISWTKGLLNKPKKGKTVNKLSDVFFGRLHIAANTQQINLKEGLFYELSLIPWALAHQDGSL